MCFGNLTLVQIHYHLLYLLGFFWVFFWGGGVFVFWGFFGTLRTHLFAFYINLI